MLNGCDDAHARGGPLLTWLKMNLYTPCIYVCAIKKE